MKAYFMEDGEKCYAPYYDKSRGIYGFKTPRGFIRANDDDVMLETSILDKEDRIFEDDK